MKKINLTIALTLIGLLVVIIVIKPFRNLRSFNSEPIIKLRSIDSMSMVLVPAGKFIMGSGYFGSIRKSGDDLFVFPDQRPEHRVYLDSFWIDQTEVTVGMFRKFVNETAYITDAEKEGWGKPWKDGPKEDEWTGVEGINWEYPHHPGSKAEADHPVIQVSWNDAKAYCKWAGADLPTEAQWEKAARGTDGRRYPWGNKFNVTYLNYGDSCSPVKRWADIRYNDGFEYTSPAGFYPSGASPYGALDMCGNVWEWVDDYYDEEYYQNSPDSNPGGPSSGSLRAMRGGSWYDGNASAWVTTTIRHQNPANDRYEDLGFRCAKLMTNER